MVMYKKICLLGDKNQFIPFDYSQKADIALQSMGLNSGNNVFGFALQKMTLTKTQCVDMVSLSHFLILQQKLMRSTTLYFILRRILLLHGRKIQDCVIG